MPHLGEHLFPFLPIDDQTKYFDHRYPGIVAEAKKKIQERVEDHLRWDVCGQGRLSVDVEGYVILSVVPRNRHDEDADWTGYDQPGNRWIFDDVHGDRPQTPAEARQDLGQFWFRIAPQTLKFQQIGEVYEKTCQDGEALCCRRMAYSAKLELRDSLGGWKGFRKVTRAEWNVEGEIECCRKK